MPSFSSAVIVSALIIVKIYQMLLVSVQFILAIGVQQKIWSIFLEKVEDIWQLFPLYSVAGGGERKLTIKKTWHGF